MDDEEEDCALCGGPCTSRLEEMAAFELRQREEMRLKYGTDDPTVCMRIVIQQLAEIAGLGSGRES